ncbi:unnamed protein product [Lactuca saligna]|uniref:Uncharacterized protein n=1 Tax=Lactuca saligna TaxID=75948 RepID=A0AA35YZ76_LACSI|nr:unnamed protein product [Lactuca saligna]
MAALQTKQAAMEERLQTLTQNPSNRREEDDESMDKMFKSDRFDNPSEQVRGRGCGTTFGANLNGKFSYEGGLAARGKGLIQEGAGRGSSKPFESWQTGEPSLSNTNGTPSKEKGQKEGIRGHQKNGKRWKIRVTMGEEYQDSSRWSFPHKMRRVIHLNGFKDVKTSSKNNKPPLKLGLGRPPFRYKFKIVGGTISCKE